MSPSKKNKSIALKKLIELGNDGLITLMFTQENNETNRILIGLKEFDEKGNYIEKNVS